MKSVVQKDFLCCVETPQLCHTSTTLPIFSPSDGHADHFICTSVSRVPYWTQRATHLKQRSHECSPKKVLICSIPYLVHEVWWICSCEDLWTRSYGIENMKSRTLHVSMTGHPNNGLSILGEWAGQQEPRVQDVCQQKPVSMD